jgi:hypothetical protein
MTGIIALEPAFATGAALGVALVAIGLAISFFAAEQWGLLGTRHYDHRRVVAGGRGHRVFLRPISLSVLLFLALAVAIRSSILMALVPLTLVGALGSSTGYAHAVYVLTVSEPSITIVLFAIFSVGSPPYCEPLHWLTGSAAYTLDSASEPMITPRDYYAAAGCGRVSSNPRCATAAVAASPSPATCTVGNANLMPFSSKAFLIIA